jgi:hypothetical protein
MHQQNNYPQLDPKQAELLEKRLEQNEEPIPSEIKIIVEDSPSTHPKDTVVEPPPEMFADKQESQTEKLKARVKDLENEIKEISVRRAGASSSKTFKDSYGNETYYVKNVSGNHIVISDLENMDKIEKGKVADLLESASLEELQRSRDVRKILHDPMERYLKRLTEEEYYIEREQELLQEKKIKLMSQQDKMKSITNPEQNKELLPHEKPPVDFSQTHKIRPVIESKLGKLALRNDPNPEHSMYAMTSIEFIEWVNSEALTHGEIDFIMGDPNVSRDYNIRAALLEKKRTVKE